VTWTISDNLADYLAVAGDFLRSDPVRNTIHLTTAESLGVRGPAAFGQTPPLFGWWRGDGGEVTAAVLHTPPHPILVTRLPERSARPLAEALLARHWQVPGVNAEQNDAAAFAAAWSGLTGAGVRESGRIRLFRLGRLRPPSPPPDGAARLATDADRDLLASWFAAFSEEVGEVAHRDEREAVDDRLSHHGLTVWEAGGAAVAMAGVNRRVAGTVRVAPVYTPPEHRRRGYAGGATAAVARAALGSGAQNVVLFTDLANPTSNSVYQRLGFLPVEERVVLVFRS